MSFPLLITSSGIIVSLLTTLLATDLKPAKSIDEIESTLKNQLIVSTVFMTPVRPPHPPRPATTAPPGAGSGAKAA